MWAGITWLTTRAPLRTIWFGRRLAHWGVWTPISSCFNFKHCMMHVPISGNWSCQTSTTDMHLQYSIYAPSHGQRRSYGVTERIAYCYYAAYSRLLSKNLKIFPVVLHGSEACSLALREERRLRVFENRILKQIFGPKRGANGEWKRLHNVCTVHLI